MRWVLLFACMLFGLTSHAFSQGGWVVRNAPAAAGVDLHGVFAIDDSTAVAVGDGGTIIRTTDGGWTWTRQISSTTQNLRDVMFVKNDWSSYQSGAGLAVGDTGTILQSVDSGKTWIARKDVTTVSLRSVGLLNAYQFAIAGDSGRVLYSSNAGTTWRLDTLVLKKSKQLPSLNAVAFINNDMVVAVGDSGKAFSRHYGLSLPWKELNSGTTNDLLDLTAHLLGFGQLLAVGRNGTLLLTEDNGDTWTPSSYGTDLPRLGAAWPDGNAIFVVGGGGQVFAATEYLKSWVEQSSGTVNDLHAVSFANATHGFAVGADGTIITTVNGGVVTVPPKNWKEVIPRPQQYSLRAVQAITASIATTVGERGAILRSSDAGRTWTSQVSNVTIDLLGVEFSDINNGIVVGVGGVILRTSNGGETWTSIASGTNKDLRSVSFSDAQIVVAVGQSGAVIRSTDAGLTWAASANDLDLQRDFNSIDFAGSGIAVAVGQEDQIIRTQDGGITWTQNPRQTGGTNFTCVSFGHPGHGVPVGQYGVATAIEGGPYRTTNGGEDWRAPHCFDCSNFAVSMIDIDNGTAVAWDGYITATTNAGLDWRVDEHLEDRPRLYAVSNYNWETSIVVGERGLILYKSSAVASTNESPAAPTSSLMIYPNPISDLTTVQVRGATPGSLRIDIIDALGNIVRTLHNSPTALDTFTQSYDLSPLSTGTYRCRVMQDSRVVSQMLTIVR